MLPLYVFAIPSIIAVITTVALLFYLSLRGPKTRPSLMLRHFFASLFIVSVGEIGLVMSGNNVQGAVFWYPFIATGSILALWQFLYFTQIFPTRTDFIKSGMGKLLLTVSLVIGFFMIAYDMYRSITYASFQGSLNASPMGYYTISEMGWKYWGEYRIFSWAYLGVMISVTIFALSLKYATEARQNRLAIAYLLCGVILMYGIGYLSEILLPAAGIRNLGVSSIFIAIMVLISSYAIVKTQILMVRAAKEEKTIQITEPFEAGFYYAVIEDNYKEPKTSYDMFCRYVKGGIQGLIVTTREPASIRKKYGLEKTPIIQLARPGQGGGGGRPPYDLVVELSPEQVGVIAEKVLEFLRTNKKSVMIIDCLSYVVETGGDSPRQHFITLEIIRNFVEFITHSESVMIVSMDRRWTNVGPGVSIIKMRHQLMLRAGNFWSVMLLEQMINHSISGIGRENEDEVAGIMAKLRRLDKFFLKVEYKNGEVYVNHPYTEKFTYQEMLHYFKFFLREAEPLVRVDLGWVRETLEKFEISRYEYDLESGHGYLVYTAERKKVFEIFMDLVERDYPGLLISRSHPRAYENISRSFKENADFRWLTDVGQGDYALLPRLEHIQREVEDFTESHPGSCCVVVLDNIAYLVKHTGSLDEVHLFLANLRDIVSVHGGILVVPVDKKAFSAEATALLSQELVEVDYT
jgi:hypothetical protein